MIWFDLTQKIKWAESTFDQSILKSIPPGLAFWEEVMYTTSVRLLSLLLHFLSPTQATILFVLYYLARHQYKPIFLVFFMTALSNITVRLAFYRSIFFHLLKVFVVLLEKTTYIKINEAL